jgi:hypothetical protein
MDHGKYFQYYIQGDVLDQDHINHLLLGDLLEVSVGWSIMSITDKHFTGMCCVFVFGVLYLMVSVSAVFLPGFK